MFLMGFLDIKVCMDVQYCMCSYLLSVFSVNNKSNQFSAAFIVMKCDV